MPFGIIGRTGPGMRPVVVFGDPSAGRGTFGANLGRAIVTNEDFAAYVCDCAATQTSSQITLGKRVLLRSKRAYILDLASSRTAGFWLSLLAVEAPGIFILGGCYRLGVPMGLQGWSLGMTIINITPLVMTAQTRPMSFRYELACKGFSTEKAHHLVT